MLLQEFGNIHERTAWCLLLFWKSVKAESLLSSSWKKMETTMEEAQENSSGSHAYYMGHGVRGTWC